MLNIATTNPVRPASFISRPFPGRVAAATSRYPRNLSHTRGEGNGRRLTISDLRFVIAYPGLRATGYSGLQPAHLANFAGGALRAAAAYFL